MKLSLIISVCDRGVPSHIPAPSQAVVNEDHQGDAVVLQGEVRRLREELSIFRTLHAKVRVGLV